GSGASGSMPATTS
nr:RecName: Full=Activity-dependent peptide [Helix pomatia]